MKPRDSGLRYHGFDTATRNVKIYSNDLEIKNIKLDFPQFRITIENLIMGHAVPAGGGTRTLALEISFKDSGGNEIYGIRETFAKKFNQMPVTGLMPYKLISNTQLKSGEVRPLAYTLPAAIKGRIAKAVIVMKFYEVSDEYEGDIEHAYWTSEPFFSREMRFTVD